MEYTAFICEQCSLNSNERIASFKWSNSLAGVRTFFGEDELRSKFDGEIRLRFAAFGSQLRAESVEQCVSLNFPILADNLLECLMREKSFSPTEDLASNESNQELFRKELSQRSCVRTFNLQILYRTFMFECPTRAYVRACINRPISIRLFEQTGGKRNLRLTTKRFFEREIRWSFRMILDRIKLWTSVYSIDFIGR